MGLMTHTHSYPIGNERVVLIRVFDNMNSQMHSVMILPNGEVT